MKKYPNVLAEVDGYVFIESGGVCLSLTQTLNTSVMWHYFEQLAKQGYVTVSISCMAGCKFFYDRY